MHAFLREIRASLLSTLALAALLCGLFPLLVWGIGSALFPHQAGGSLITRPDGTVIGSELIAQGFTTDRYFQPRPSAAGNGYDATNSGGTNLGPTSKKLSDSITAAVAAYRKTNGLADGTPVPADAVTSSGSGLDPDISVANALLQAPRVAHARGLDPADVRRLIASHVQERDLALFGERRVNVLQLNLALDRGATGGP